MAKQILTAPVQINNVRIPDGSYEVVKLPDRVILSVVSTNDVGVSYTIPINIYEHLVQEYIIDECSYNEAFKLGDNIKVLVNGVIREYCIKNINADKGTHYVSLDLEAVD